MARVVAFVPDLLFGSNVLGALQAGGHDPMLVSRGDALQDALAGADALIVDLTADAEQRLEQVQGCRPASLPALAFYSHVESEVRARAHDAGIELVVPRSRMAREGSALVDRLLSET